MQTWVYIIPGYRESIRSTGYRKIASAFRKKNITPVFVKIQWKYTSIQNYLDQFAKQIRNPDDEFYFFGFSFGAMIAFITATQFNPKKLFICSLSPFFRENLPGLNKSARKSLGKKRLGDLASLSFNQLAKNIICKTFIAVGQQELPSVFKLAQNAKNKIKQSELFIVQNGKHDVSQPEYTQAVLKIIR